MKNYEDVFPMEVPLEPQDDLIRFLKTEIEKINKEEEVYANEVKQDFIGETGIQNHTNYPDAMKDAWGYFETRFEWLYSYGQKRGLNDFDLDYLIKIRNGGVKNG